MVVRVTGQSLKRFLFLLGAVGVADEGVVFARGIAEGSQEGIQRDQRIFVHVGGQARLHVGFGRVGDELSVDLSQVIVGGGEGVGVVVVYDEQITTVGVGVGHCDGAPLNALGIGLARGSLVVGIAYVGNNAAYGHDDQSSQHDHQQSKHSEQGIGLESLVSGSLSYVTVADGIEAAILVGVCHIIYLPCKNGAAALLQQPECD